MATALTNVKFSIIVPTFNSAKYVAECISSILSQSCQNFEIILIDNFSTDKTIEVVKQFNQNKIKIFQKRNFGIIAASRNFGISKASGEYLAFLDSDDFWYPEKLQVCETSLGNCDMICHLLDGAHKKNQTKNKNKITFLQLFLRGNCIATSSVIVKKSLIKKFGQFDEERDLVTAEDYDLWLRLLKNQAVVEIINQNLGFYRQHENNTSGYKQYSMALSFLLKKWEPIVSKPFLILRYMLLCWELFKFKHGF
jgi:glycosyltransferase involved in cell wall biosynthesis